VAHLDLTDRASVAAFADGWSGPLQVLVNNAGVMASPEMRNARGLGAAVRPPTTSGTSRSRSACARRWPPTAKAASWP